MQVTTGSWQPGPEPPKRPTLTLALTNVASLTVDTAAARLPRGTAAITTDGPTRLTLAHLAPGTLISTGTTARVGSAGKVTITLAAGTSKFNWSPPHHRHTSRRKP
jgi:hypothetical protein